MLRYVFQLLLALVGLFGLVLMAERLNSFDNRSLVSAVFADSLLGDTIYDFTVKNAQGEDVSLKV